MHQPRDILSIDHNDRFGIPGRSSTCCAGWTCVGMWRRRAKSFGPPPRRPRHVAMGLRRWNTSPKSSR